MNEDRDAHIKGLPRLLDPFEKDRARRLLETAAGRVKFRLRLEHKIQPHPDYSTVPSKGSRSDAHMLAELRRLGAPPRCYVVASDSPLDDSFQPLDEMVSQAGNLFEHAAFLSCIPGRLAFFRAGYPQPNAIVFRPE